MKRFYFFCITIVLVPQILQGQVSVWNGTAEIWSHGNGTKDNPYLIENAQNLNYIAEMVNGGFSHYDGIYFKLTTDIQIDSTHIWQPIGLDQTNYFSGNFDGDNHLISIFMNNTSYEYAGLFGYIAEDTIVNLRCTGSISQPPYSSGYIGGITGFSLASLIKNCHNSCTIRGYYKSGGITGSALNTNVQSCSNTGHIYGYYAGGIIGYNQSSNTFLHLCNNYNTGDVETSYCAGGIIGESEQNNTSNMQLTVEHIYRCYNSGRIVADSSSPYGSNIYLGGIVGITQSISVLGYAYWINGRYENRGYVRPQQKIYHCYNSGTIENLSAEYAIGGGINAHQYSEQYTYKYWYYHANGSSSYDIRTAYKYSEIFINNCFNVGNIQTSSGNAIGPGTVTNCHYLNTCGMDGDGTSRTETQMKAVWFPIILNADSVEFVVDLPPYDNNGYPIFGNVQTRDVTGLSRTTATLNGVYNMPYDIDSHGFEYKLSADTGYTVVLSADDTPTSYTLNGLQSGTSYDYRFYIEKNGTILRGTEYSFTTIECTLSANILSTTDDFCEGDTVVYHVEVSSTTPSSYQFIWNTGDSSDIIQVVDTATYSITVTDIYGCTATDSKQSIMHQKPIIEISGNTHPCEGDWAYLYASGGDYYFWNTNNTSNSIYVLENGTYYVTVSDIHGCISYDSVTVAFQPLPTVTITGDSIFCQGSSTTLTASGAETYEWWNGEHESSITVNYAGSYTVTGTDTNGCTTTATQTVFVNPSYEIQSTQTICPNESYDFFGQTLTTEGTYSHTLQTVTGCDSIFTLTLIVKPFLSPTISGNTSICQGETTTLMADGGYSYVWSNASTSNYISVNQSGVYTVTATDADGCSATADIIVTVNPLPNISISGNSTLCAGNSTTLTASGANAYSWSTGENTASVTISYFGIYTVTGTSIEGCSNTANITVLVSQLPNITISGETDICAGESTTLTATNGETFLWNDGTTDSSLIVNVAGTYQVIGYDSNGCANTATKTVSEHPTYNTPLTHSMCEGESYNFYGQNITMAGTYTHTLQTVNGCDSVLTLSVTLEALPPTAITGNTTICEGETTTLTASGGTTYVWSTGGANSSISVSQSGVYSVTATNTQGCSAPASVTVTVNPLPNVTVSGNTTICQGNSTSLTANGAISYLWSTGENTASVTINAFGIYTVTGTSTEGCSNTANVTVLVSQLPNITITGETDLCAGETTTLTANGGETYLWSDGTTSNSLTVGATGTYQVIGYNATGCNAMASTDVHVWQPASSEFSITTPDSCYEWNSVPYCASGDYTQTLQTIHGCDSVVTLHLTITVGINDLNDFDFKVYPNPTTGIVNVECAMINTQAETVEFYVLDAFGRLLQSTNGVGANNHSLLRTAQFDMSGYAAGVYFVKAVADGNVVAVRKIIRN